MAKDLMQNKVNIGDKVVFNNMVCTVKEINENRILGGKMITHSRGTGIKIPDTMILELELNYEADKPMNFFVVKTPPETGAAEA